MSDNPALLELAQALNATRGLANAIPSTAPQDHAYGDIAEALKKVLRLILDTEDQAAMAYQVLLDGETTAYALSYARQESGS